MTIQQSSILIWFGCIICAKKLIQAEGGAGSVPAHSTLIYLFGFPQIPLFIPVQRVWRWDYEMGSVCMMDGCMFHHVLGFSPVPKTRNLFLEHVGLSAGY